MNTEKVTKELVKILKSPEYRDDLNELSAYAASIKQERPMIVLLSKYLYQKGYIFAMEDQRCDLVIYRTNIEFKFHYDFDLIKLQKELKKWGTAKAAYEAAKRKEESETWTVAPGLYKDICLKRGRKELCEIFRATRRR